MLSCIYEGHIRHRRQQPVTHGFRYRMFAVYVDLTELDRLIGPGGLISQRRLSGGSLLRSDHLGDPHEPLDTSVRNFVQHVSDGFRPEGPIRLLTQLRYLGYYFSPLNLYYCFDVGGDRVDAIVAEVSNTPWREMHCYVLWDGNRQPGTRNLRFEHPKNFHVSPFMGMDSTYRWRLSLPGDSLYVAINTERNRQPFFTATMVMKRHPLDHDHLRRMKRRFPWMTVRIMVQIYFEAWRLWLKKCPYYPHPNRT